MSPTAFTFTLTLPRDPQVATIVIDVARHAATYAGLSAAAGADFVARVSAAATVALAARGEPSCAIVATGDAVGLTFTIGADSVAVRHAS